MGSLSDFVDQAPLEVLIIGAGLGGLSCAIGCLRKGLKVTLLEKDAELTEVRLIVA